MLRIIEDHGNVLDVEDRPSGARLLRIRTEDGQLIAIELDSGQAQEIAQALNPYPEEDREDLVPKGHAPGETSDGYHTFNELYDHRRALTAALAYSVIQAEPDAAWRSRAHHSDDNPCYDGYFIVGVNTPWGPITYHYANQFWDDFRQVPVLPHAPKWDGAPPWMTVTRLIAYARA